MPIWLDWKQTKLDVIKNYKKSIKKNKISGQVSSWLIYILTLNDIPEGFQMTEKNPIIEKYGKIET